ncbi:MAG TPA: HAMP domain-containing sensor histidine kinase [Jiangellaceae bacterium]
MKPREVLQSGRRYVASAFGRVRAGVRRLPLRTRVGALAALGVGLAILATAIAAYATVSVQLTNSVDQDLRARAYDAVPGVLTDPTELQEIPGEAFGASYLRVALLRSDNVAVSPRGESTIPPLGDDELDVARGITSENIRTASLDDQTYRVVAVPVTQDWAFVLAQSTETVDEVLQQLGLVSFLAGALGIGLAAWAGASIARAGLRPVERLTAAAEHVAETGSLDPITVDGGDDELARLAHSFNAMLAALDEARLRQRQLVADAGHELRTPLTSLRTNLDLLVQSDRQGGLDGADRTALLSDVRAQLEELSTLVVDLIELARDPQSQPPFEIVDFADLVRDALSRARRRAPDVTFSADLRPFLVDGDATLLTRAAINLLDNAAKWSPPGGTVSVTLHEGTLEVRDEGPGIAEADLPHVFERFYRSTGARGLAGSGLGLAIVRAAAERHGGSVDAGHATSGGARLTITLPPASSRAETLTS